MIMIYIHCPKLYHHSNGCQLHVVMFKVMSTICVFGFSSSQIAVLGEGRVMAIQNH